ncbi:RHS repeat-associated core domain-containing protein, partial [Kitasatospora sp. NPDC056731]|uniref:DUF6973 domain-containing protein n=1 Tax=Kitasatospora sp. NPDC056731 TaxID=3155422 RepID=UPI00341CAD30
QYQPSTGRFLSADPLLLPTDPQQWNAYVYSNNDPVNKTDPTGMALEECASGMAKCSNMGTKIEGEGENYQKIVAQIQKEQPARHAGYVRFRIAKGLPLGPGWVGSMPSDVEAEKAAARRAYGFELENEYKKNTQFKYETQPGQTQIPGAQPYDSLATGKAKKSELMFCAYVGALDCFDMKQITGWSGEVPYKEYPEDKGHDTPKVNAFRHFTWQAMITAKYGRQNAEMVADAHEAFGVREGHGYADHISDLVNNEYGRKMGERIGAANAAASDSQLKAVILDEARKYIASDDFARPSDFE